MPREELCRRVCNMLLRTFPLTTLNTLDLHPLDTYYDSTKPPTELPEGFINFFLQLMNVHELSIYAKYINSSVFEALNTPTAQGSIDPSSAERMQSCILPALQRLTLRQGYDEKPLDMDVVRAFVSSRHDMGLPVSHVRVHRHYTVDRYMLAEFRAGLYPLTTLGCHVDFSVPQESDMGPNKRAVVDINDIEPIDF